MAVAKKTSGLDPELMKWGALLLGGYFVFDHFFGKSKETKESEAEEKKITDLPPDKNPLNDGFRPISKMPAGNIIIRSTKTIPSVPANYFSSAVVQLKNAIGTFTDDESAIISALKKAATQFEINIMAKTYQVLYKRDLMYDLKDNLSAKELLPIYQHINKLPYFIKGKKIK